jgi:beta-glucosidase
MTQQWDLGNYYVIGGSGRVISPYTVPILQGITTRANQAGVKIISDTSDNVQNSINLINQAGIGILCGATTSTEGHDRANILLDQDNFISQVLSNTSKNSNVKTIVLMQTPAVVLTNWRDQTNALFNMFLAGQETGNAWAQVLWGDVNPSGKLPITLPLSESDTILPCPSTECVYSEGLKVGYRSFQGKNVAYPFGHGLSYTTFDYAWDTPPTTSGCGTGEVVCFKVTVKNTGSKAGATVVQAYIDFPDAAGEPLTQLKGFKKVSLNSGASTTVSFGLTSRDVSIYNTSSKNWSQVSGTFTIYASASSRDHKVNAKVTI